MNAVVGETRKRGDYVETIIKDGTRVGHPVAASVFEFRGEYLVVPDNPEFPVKCRDTFDGAVSYVEQIIPDEHRRIF